MVSAEELESNMRLILSGNNQLIKKATQVLRTITGQQQCFAQLFRFLEAHPEKEIRQLATVLLKRKLIKLFEDQRPEDQSQIKSLLLRRFAEESSTGVKAGIAGLIGQVVSIVGFSNWPELEQLFTTHSSGDLKITLVLLKNLMGHMQPAPILVELIMRALRDPNLLDEALQCISNFVEGDEFNQPQLATFLMHTAEECSWGADQAYSLLQIFTSLLYKKGHINQQNLAFVCNKFVLNHKASTRLRETALDLLIDTSQFKQKLLKGDLLKLAIHSAAQIISEGLEEKEVHEQTLQHVALIFIENLSSNLPAKRVYPLLLSKVEELIRSESSKRVGAAFLLLAAMSEGCADCLRTNLSNPLMNTFLPLGLNSPDPYVKSCVVRTVTYFTEFLIPDIVYYHKLILPTILTFIEGSHPGLAEKAMVALEVLLENMDEEDCQEMSGLVMPVLGKCLENKDNSVFMRKVLVSAIGSCLVSAGEQFSTYLPGVNTLIEECFRLRADQSQIKAEAVKLLGEVAAIFCKSTCEHKLDVFRNMVEPRVEPIYELLRTSKDPDIKEACFSFFYNLAFAIEEEFGLLFDRIMELALLSAQSNDGIEEVKPEGNQLSLDTDSEDSNQEYNVNTSYFNERSAAVHCLGELAKSCPLRFAPFIPRVLQILQENEHHFFQDLKLEVITCYKCLGVSVVKQKHGGRLPPVVLGLPVAARFDQEAEQFLNKHCLFKMRELVENEASSEVIAHIIDCLEELLKQLGPAFLDRHLDLFVSQINEWLGREHTRCDGVEVGEREEDDEAETDIPVFESLTDLIARLAKVFKVGFVPGFMALLPQMLKYTEREKDVNDNIQIVGCFAECFKHCPQIVKASYSTLLPVLLKMYEALSTEQSFIRNLSYCLGQMYAAQPVDLAPYLNSILLILKNVFQHSISPAAKDNALSSICRIVVAAFPPLPYAAFIEQLAKSLPLVGDVKENRVVLGAVCFLEQKLPEQVGPFRQHFAGVMQSCLSEHKKFKVKQPILSEVRRFLQR